MIRIGVLLCVVGLVASGPSPLRSKEEVEEYRTFLQSTKTGNGTYLLSSSALNPESNIWENSGKFEGDIILDDEQIDELVQDYASGRSAYIRANVKWPNNVVVYDIAPWTFTAAQVNHIYRAMNYIQHFSCIRFRRRNAADRNYALVTGHHNGCYASVGFRSNRGIHTINLAPANPGQGCFNVVTIIHEWLHVLGFFHMHSTYNRYNYVRIAWENIQRGMEHNFERFGNNILHNMGLPYEYISCMHYGRYAFSTNRRATIIPLWAHNGVMGQQNYVTHWDWVRLGRYYNCPGAWSEEFIDQMEKEVERTKDLVAMGEEIETNDVQLE